MVLAVDCEVSQWSGWTSCSAECGTRSQTRTRSITTAAGSGGTECPAGLSESQSCNTQACAGSSCIPNLCLKPKPKPKSQPAKAHVSCCYGTLLYRRYWSLTRCHSVLQISLSLALTTQAAIQDRHSPCLRDALDKLLSAGEYFNFDRPSTYGTNGDTVTVTQCRNGASVWSGTITYWITSNGGSTGDSHGRRSSGASNNQWQLNDIITTASLCPEPGRVAVNLSNNHPNVGTSTAVLGMPCANDKLPRSECAAYCATNPACNGFWYYTNGRCCPKASWSEAQFGMSISGADGFYSYLPIQGT